jgi:hypothetical protein
MRQGLKLYVFDILGNYDYEEDGLDPAQRRRKK